MFHWKLWILSLPGEQYIENTSLEVYLYGFTFYKVALTYNILTHQLVYQTANLRMFAQFNYRNLDLKSGLLCLIIIALNRL